MSSATRRSLSPGEVKALWGRIKAEEKRLKLGSGAKEAAQSALDGVPLAMPALSRALKLQEKAGKVGFDWNDARAVLAKIREEIAEVEAEIAEGSAEALKGEVGDLLFAAVNLARHLKVDPEAALRGANLKFERRFAHIEDRLAEGRPKAGKRQPRRDGAALGRGEGQGARGGVKAARIRDSRYRNDKPKRYNPSTEYASKTLPGIDPTNPDPDPT